MALHLESEGNARDLIRLVELWQQQDEPTPGARLAEAKAFMDLCLMDRAWIRLKEVADDEELASEARLLTARMFVERGWPGRARTLLEKVLKDRPDDAEVQELWARATRPPPSPPTDLEDSDDPSALIRGAEQHLAAGALLKGQKLLEAARRLDPDSRRVQDLLWALEGDFTSESTLAELVEQHGPDLSHLAELDDVEHTESITSSHTPATWLDPVDPADSRAFPSLFREDQDPPTEEYEDASEVTQTRLMASSNQMGELSDPVGLPDEDDDTGPSGDTQILHVIEKNGATEMRAPSGPLHVSTPEDLDFDLDAYRREMGVLDELPSGSPSSDFDEGLETEDNDVIVFTRREDEEETTQALEPDPDDRTMDHPDARRFLSEQARVAADKEFLVRSRAQDRIKEIEQADTEPPPERREDPPLTRDDPADRTRNIRTDRELPTAPAPPWWFYALGVVLMLAGIFLSIVVAWQLFGEL